MVFWTVYGTLDLILDYVSYFKAKQAKLEWYTSLKRIKNILYRIKKLLTNFSFNYSRFYDSRLQ